IPPHKWGIFEKNIFMGGKKALVLVVDDHPMMCESFVLALKNYVLGIYTVTTEEEAKQICKSYDIRVAFIDARLQPGSGIELTKFLKTKYGQLKVVGYTTFSEEATVAEFLGAGVVGFLEKSEMRTVDILECLDRVLADEPYFPAWVEKIREKLLAKHVFASTQLSNREKEIAVLLSRGLSHKQIAEKLSLAKNTVDDYCKQMLQKTRTKSSVELMGFLLRNGVL
ncbi:MAG: response regulator, partial [Bacteroidota bacterium]